MSIPVAGINIYLAWLSGHEKPLAVDRGPSGERIQKEEGMGNKKEVLCESGGILFIIESGDKVY